MPTGFHKPRSTLSRAAGSDLLHWSLPLHISLLMLNGCCPRWSLSLEPFILVDLSSLSLCSLYLYVTFQFLAREHKVTWLLAIVTKLLSTLSTLSTLALPSASTIVLHCSMVCNPHATTFHCTKIHWMWPIACSFTMSSCYMLC